MKKNEEESLSVQLRQSGLDQRRVPVKVYAKRLRSGENSVEGETILVAQRELESTARRSMKHFPFKPTETGRFQFIIEVDPQQVKSSRPTIGWNARSISAMTFYG